MQTFRLGRLGIALEGDDPILPLVASELVAIAEERAGTDTRPEPGLEIRFEPPPQAADAALVDGLEVTADAFSGHRSGLDFAVAGGRPRRLWARSAPFTRWRHRLPPAVARFLNWNHLTPREVVAKNFFYDLFDFVSQTAQLQLGQSYLHAAGFERDGRAVVLAGWGGAGKTSAMLRFVLAGTGSFLSDDLAVIDDSGTVWRSPKRLQVYGYNVTGDPALADRLLTGRSAADRLAWRLFHLARGPRRVRRRVSAEELFGAGRVARAAPLGALFVLEGTARPELSAVALPREEAAERLTETLLSELSPLVEVTSAVRSVRPDGFWPTLAEIAGTTRAVLFAALVGVEPVRVDVPRGTEPAALHRFLDRRLG